MRLDIARQKRVQSAGGPPAYVVTATLHISKGEWDDATAHGLADYEIDLEIGEDEESVPVEELRGGREFPLDNAADALALEETLASECSDFAQLLIDSVEFGGSEQYELPLEDDEDEDEDE